MAKPRTPSNVLALRGSDKKHPDRMRLRADEPKPATELGSPPAHLPAEVVTCWLEIVGIAHQGTLFESDRLVVEHGARLLAELRGTHWRVPTATLLRFEVFLSKLGLTPADRSRVSTSKKQAPGADPLDEFSAAC